MPEPAPAAASPAGTRPDRISDRTLDRTLDRLDAWVPKPAALAFAVRIWVAMMAALYLAFWLQLDSTSSAAVGVAILAQPKRGQAISKAVYRLLGTILGGAVSLLFLALFGQDRVEMLVAFTLWLGLCVFVAQYLQDTRAYGAMLSGYTVAIIAVAHLDTPQNGFDATVARLAAITLAIVVITFINDALASPSTWRSLRPQLAAAHAAVQDFCRAAFAAGDPGVEWAAALIARIAPMRADASAIAGELDDGSFRAAGARSGIAALYAMVAASRAVARARAELAQPSPEAEEALAICRTAVGEWAGETGGGPDMAALAARLRDLVDASLRAGDRPLDEIALLQRALDFVVAATFAADGLHALATGDRPLRDVDLPTHRDFPVALRAAFRVAIAFAITASLFVASGLPQSSFALVQVAATCSLSSVTPDPRKFALGVLMGMPLAALMAGLVLFGLLNGNQGFPLLALAMAPPILLGCLLALNPPTFTVGFISLVFFPALLAPSNPQGYDAGTFFLNAFLVVLAALILFLTVRLVLPVTAAQHRAYALDSARRDLAGALAGEGGDATTRTSLNADRLYQFAGYSSGSGAVRRMALAHAFALAQIEAAAARAHGQMHRLRAADALRGPIERARAALRAGHPGRLEAAARDLVQAASAEPRPSRLCTARAAADLVAAARVIARHRRFLRRLGVAPF
ncbi:p-hydroxybenzoic acid efflux pump subunit AaeB [Methylobacterium dankookense]|uniref:p-hydroxybenzoic acid efflux pump subunit AaeB n=1 Tax=Methylobacterium dankookense TaxID=560405 RepID=A0A564G3K0_9HYPH|nr:p-hydroxybenzoic acid efflux pump subunit AaeB [Methylobacterium dankookense]VUF14877.1 p-hydroxybenzoic acid efflux pump subunit AaeB [Methylobacterium dankookense]